MTFSYKYIYPSLMIGLILVLLSTGAPIGAQSDTTPPVVSANNASADWFANRTVTLSASDDDVGVNQARYAWDENPMNAECTSGGDTFVDGDVITVSEGSHSLFLCARDANGNVGTWESGDDQYRVDSTAPLALAQESIAIDGINGWHQTNPIITLTGNDLLSGVEASSIEYRWNSDPWTSGQATTIPSDGTHTLEYRLVDNAGNPSASQPKDSEDGVYNAEGESPLFLLPTDEVVNDSGNTVYAETGYSVVRATDLIPVDPEKAYQLSARFRSVSAAQSIIGFGVEMYDEDENPISVDTIIRRGNALTVQSVNDTQIIVSTSTPINSEWCNSISECQSASDRHLGLYLSGDTNSLPDIMVRNGAYTVATEGTLTITLAEPLSSETVSSIIPGVTRVMNHVGGSETVSLSVTSESTIPTEWTEFSALLSGEEWGLSASAFVSNTAYVRIFLSLNTNQTQDEQVYVDDIVWEQIPIGIKEYKLDTINPTITSVVTDPGTLAPNADWYTVAPTVQTQGSDGGSGLLGQFRDLNISPPTTLYEQATISQTFPQGNNTDFVFSQDLSGRISSIDATVYRVDATAPGQGSVSHTNGAQNSTNVSVSVNRGSDAESSLSLQNTDYQLEQTTAPLSGDTCGLFAPFADANVDELASATSYLAEGIHATCMRFRYTVANQAGLTTTFTSDDITKVDTQAPVLSSQTTFPDPWYNTPQVSIFTYTDETTVIASGGTVQCDITQESTNATCTLDGTQFALPNVCDQAGNCNTDAVTSNSLQLDLTPPTLGADNASDDWFVSRTVTLSTADALSGLATNGARYAWDINEMNEECTTGGTLFSDQTTIAVPVGSHQLFLCARDNAGNIAEWDSGADQYRVDGTPPTISASPLPSADWSESFSLSLFANDGASEISSSGARYTWGNNTLNGDCTSGGNIFVDNDTIIPPLGENILFLCARDNAGNIAEWDSGTEYRIDASAPITTSFDVEALSSLPLNAQAGSIEASWGDIQETGSSLALSGTSYVQIVETGATFSLTSANADSTTFSGLSDNTSYTAVLHIEDVVGNTTEYTATVLTPDRTGRKSIDFVLTTNENSVDARVFRTDANLEAFFSFEAQDPSSAISQTADGNSVTFTNTSLGAGKERNGQALRFNGNGTGNMETSIILTDDTPWTVSYWFLHDDSANTHVTLGESGTDANTIRHEGTGSSSAIEFTNSANQSVSFGVGENIRQTWKYLTITADGTDSDNLRLYIDGRLKSTVSLANSAFTINAIGNSSNTSGEYWNGSLDEVMVWSTNLSTREIIDGMQSGAMQSKLERALQSFGPFIPISTATVTEIVRDSSVVDDTSPDDTFSFGGDTISTWSNAEDISVTLADVEDIGTTYWYRVQTSDASGNEDFLPTSVSTEFESGLSGYATSWTRGETDIEILEQNVNAGASPLISPDVTDGDWYLNIRAVDMSGNWTSDTIHHGPFQIDQTDPECGDWIPDPVPWTGTSPQEFEFSSLTPARDSGGSGLQTQNDESCNSFSYNESCTIELEDRAGNTTTCIAPPAQIDQSAPTTTASIAGGNTGDNGWYTSSVTVEITPFDGLSGIDDTLYCIDTTNTCIPSTPYTAPFSVNEEGTNFVRYFSNDLVNNVQPTQSLTINIDSTPPVVTASVASAVASDPDTIETILTPADGASGILGARYVIDTDSDSLPSAAESAGSYFATAQNVTLQNIGNYTISYWAKDIAGNQTTGTFEWYSITSSPTSCNFNPFALSNQRTGLVEQWLESCGATFFAFVTENGVSTEATLNAIGNFSTGGIDGVIDSFATTSGITIPRATLESVNLDAKGLITFLLSQTYISDAYLCSNEVSRLNLAQIIKNFHLDDDPFHISVDLVCS